MNTTNLITHINHVITVCLVAALTVVNMMYVMINLTYMWAEPSKGLAVLSITFGVSGLVFIIASTIAHRYVKHVVSNSCAKSTVRDYGDFGQAIRR